MVRQSHHSHHCFLQRRFWPQKVAPRIFDLDPSNCHYNLYSIHRNHNLPNSARTHPDTFWCERSTKSIFSQNIVSVFSGVFVQIGMTLLMSVIGHVIVRTGQAIDVSRPNLTFEQQERFKWYTRDVLYLFAASINMTNMFSSFATWQIIGYQYMLPLILIPVFAGTSVLLIVVMSFGQMGSRLRVPRSADENTGLTNRNDDRDWKGGVVNYDKDSSAVVVPKRFGIGWTLNFANPKSWIILAIIIGVPLVIIVIRILIH